MPRKVISGGESTQQRRTSMKRAVGVAGRGPRAVTVADGGKWAGSGRKTVEHYKGPQIARQAQPGRGAKTRTAERSKKKNHPNHG
jgi:hypothetical protein